MLDRAILCSEAFCLLLVAAICVLVGYPTYGISLSVVVILILAIAQAIKPYEPPKLSKDVFDTLVNTRMTTMDVKAFVKAYSSDPNFIQSIMYMHGLSAIDFMRLVRICIELRQTMDSAAMKETAAHVRSETRFRA